MCNTLKKVMCKYLFLVPNEFFMFILQVVDIFLHILRFITSISEISVTSNKKLSPCSH